jgi:MFS family permease
MFSKDNYVYIACLAILPLMVCSGIIYSILPLYIVSLGASRSVVGLVYTCGAVAGAVTSPLWGKFSDKKGRKLTLVISMILFAFVFLGYTLSKHYTQLYFIQVVEGVAWGALGASAIAMIADSVPVERRGKAMGIYNSTLNLGWIIGPLAGGFLSEHIGFRYTFFICVLFIIADICVTELIVTSKKRIG